MEFAGRLIPLMREGIEVIKMILFKKLRGHLAQQYPEDDELFWSRLTGAVINELFGAPNPQGPFATFSAVNRDRIAAGLRDLARTLSEMRAPLTDALRMQTLCDLQEGRDSSPLLVQARELNLLLNDRELPLPHTFMELARKLGAGFGLIIPPLPADSPSSPVAN